MFGGSLWSRLFPSQEKLDRILKGQDGILRQIGYLRGDEKKTQQFLKEMKKLMADKFDVILERIQEMDTVVDGTMALVDSLIEARDDPEQIQDIIGKMDAQRDKLAAYLAENTPEEPPVEEPPVEEPPVEEPPVGEDTESGTEG